MTFHEHESSSALRLGYKHHPHSQHKLNRRSWVIEKEQAEHRMQHAPQDCDKPEKLVNRCVQHLSDMWTSVLNMPKWRT